MTKFFSETTQGFYDTEFYPYILPKDAIKIDDDLYRELYSKRSEGKVVTRVGEVFVYKEPEHKEDDSTELSWVENELARVRDELEKVQDNDPKAVGTVSQWREYRKALRSWPENPNFPNKEFRPKAPDYKE